MNGRVVVNQGGFPDGPSPTQGVCSADGNWPETGLGEMPEQGASGIAPWLRNYLLKRHRRVVVNLSVRLASFIYSSSCLTIFVLLHLTP